MADQLPETQQRVVFSTAHLINLTEVKHLGLYTKTELFNGTIATLLASLRFVYSPEDLLVRDQKIIIRLKDAVHEQPLTTDNQPLSSVIESEKREIALKLYPADYVLILLQLAKFIQQYAPTQILQEFYEQYDERIFLREWGGGVESPTEENPSRFLFSEETLRSNSWRVNELLMKIEDAFALITQVDPQNTDGQEEAAAAAPVADGGLATAVMPSLTLGQAVDSAASPAEGGPSDTSTSTSPPLSPQERLSLEKQISWVWATAREQLIYDALRKLGIDSQDPPDQLRDQLQILDTILRSHIRDIVLSLSPEKLEQLLNGTGNIRLRIEILQMVLAELYQGERARFFTELFTLYELCLETTETAGQTASSQAIIENLEHILNESSIELSTEQTTQLQEIKQQIADWKRDFFKQLPVASEVAPEVVSQVAPTDAASIGELALSEELDALEPAPPPIHFHLRPADSEVLDQAVSQVLTKPYEQKRVQNQVARLIAGTKAELFSEKDLTQNLVPAQFTDQLSGLAIQYVLSLSPDELTKLSRSPSSLVRHIKTLYLKVLRDASFAEAYKQYASNRLPPIERTDIIETQTQSLSAVVIDELFTNQTITDTSTPDNYLQKELDHLKNYIETKIFYTVSELSTDDLIKLQLDFTQQKKLLKKIHAELNRDTLFISEINHFYTSLMTHYETAGQLDDKEQIAQKLTSGLKLESGSYKLAPIDPEQTTRLFNQKLSSIIQTDNPAVAATTATIVDSLLLTYGQADTQKLITNLSPDLLALTFGLPKGSLSTDSLQEFRSLLLSHAQSRQVLLTLYHNAAPPLAEGALPDSPGGIKLSELNKHLTPVKTVGTLISQEGSEAVAAASNPNLLKKQQKVMQGLLDEWTMLPYDQQYALYYYTVVVLKDTSVPIGASTASLFAKDKVDKVRKNTYDIDEQLPFLASYLFLRADVGTIVDKFKKDAFVESARVSQAATALEQASYEDAAARYSQVVSLQLELLQAEAEELQQELGTLPTGITVTTYAINPLDVPSVVNAPALTTTTNAEYRAPQAGGRRSLAASGIKALAKKRLKRKLAQKAGSTAARAALGATMGTVTGGLSLVATGAKSLWDFIKNPDKNPVALFAIALPIAPLFTVGGALAFGITTFLTGSPLLGLLAAPVGAYILPWQIPGLDFRMPPSPWQNVVGSGGDQVVNPSAPSLSQMRQQAAIESGQQVKSAGAGIDPQSSQAASSATAQSLTTQPTQSLSTTLTTTVPTAAGGSSGLAFGVTFSALAPLGGILSILAVTAFVLTVIYGAFLVPVPTRTTNGAAGNIVGSTLSKYVEVTKMANPAKIENNNATPIEYTIVIKPKATYSIKIKSISDTFSGFGVSTTIPQSPLTTADFPQEAITDAAPIEKKYTVTVGENTVDALIMNAFVLTFDVVDSNNFSLATDETITASASVSVGNPKMGCWPTSGKIMQLPYGGFSHSRLDAFDIGNSIGTPVYAPFPGKLCDKGTDPSPNGGYGRYASLEFSVGSATNLVLYFGHFAKGPKELSGGFDSTGCKAVQPGELIGLMDDTGYSFGSHLHYELLRNSHGMKLKDLIIDGQQTINKVNSGQAVFVNHCFK